MVKVFRFEVDLQIWIASNLSFHFWFLWNQGEWRSRLWRCIGCTLHTGSGEAHLRSWKPEAKGAVLVGIWWRLFPEAKRVFKETKNVRGQKKVAGFLGLMRPKDARTIFRHTISIFFWFVVWIFQSDFSTSPKNSDGVLNSGNVPKRAWIFRFKEPPYHLAMPRDQPKNRWIGTRFAWGMPPLEGFHGCLAIKLSS